MNTQEILEHLQSMADPRAVRAWARLRMPVESYYGVGLTKLRAFAKKVRRDHALALALWDTGVRDARLLATMIAEPRQSTRAEIERHAADFDFWDVSDNYCRGIIADTQFRKPFIMEWMDSRVELLQRSAYILLAAHARMAADEKDSFFEKHITRIEKTVLKQRNWVKEGMVYALIAMGRRNGVLRERVLACADTIGYVKIDYGESSCKAPDVRTALGNSTGAEKPRRGAAKR